MSLHRKPIVPVEFYGPLSLFDRATLIELVWYLLTEDRPGKFLNAARPQDVARSALQFHATFAAINGTPPVRVPKGLRL